MSKDLRSGRGGAPRGARYARALGALGAFALVGCVGSLVPPGERGDGSAGAAAPGDASLAGSDGGAGPRDAGRADSGSSDAGSAPDAPSGPTFCVGGAVTEPCVCGGVLVDAGHCCADAPSSAACAEVVAASILASRTEGAVPFAVFFEGTDSTDADGESIDGQGLVAADLTEYRWDFGDGTGFAGFNAAHVYETPGAYAVTLTVRDVAGNVGHATIAVRASAFAGTTYCYANGSDFTGCPEEVPAERRVTTDALVTAIGARERHLYRRGDTFGFEEDLQLNADDVVLGAFPAEGALETRPVLRYLGTADGEGTGAMRAGYLWGASRFSFVDLEFELLSPSGARATAPAGGFDVRDVLVLRTSIHDGYGFLYYEGEPDGVFLVDSEIVHMVGIPIYGVGHRWAVVGCEIGDAFENEHWGGNITLLYTSGIDRGVFSGNVFFDSPVTGLRLASNGVPWEGEWMRARNVVVSRNEFYDIGYDASHVVVTQPEGQRPSENILYEQNFVRSDGHGFRLAGTNHTHDIVYRNNVIVAGSGLQLQLNSALGQGTPCYDGEPTDPHVLCNGASRIRVYHNVVVLPAWGDHAVFVDEARFAGEGFKDVEIRNNVFASETAEMPAITLRSAADLGEVRSDHNLYAYPNLPPDHLFATDMEWSSDGVGAYHALTGWQALGGGREEGSLVGGPSFVVLSPSEPTDYALDPSSPGVNAAAPLSVSDDFAGARRPQGGAADMGAFERSE